jgi:hypothetical protein
MNKKVTALRLHVWYRAYIDVSRSPVSETRDLVFNTVERVTRNSVSDRPWHRVRLRVQPVVYPFVRTVADTTQAAEVPQDWSGLCREIQAQIGGRDG